MDVVFDFKGEINNEVLRNILKTMDEKMAEMGEDRFVRKKINSILIECLQNLIFHSEKSGDTSHAPGITVLRSGRDYEVRTSNQVLRDKAPALTSYIDKINSMNEEELRLYYQEVLTNGKFNPQGGAGLGIINIARKTKDHKVNYSFSPSTDKNLTFQMQFVV